jgi:hypothetical protein
MSSIFSLICNTPVYPERSSGSLKKRIDERIMDFPKRQVFTSLVQSCNLWVIRLT